jgi:Mg2+-importing ATPase
MDTIKQMIVIPGNLTGYFEYAALTTAEVLARLNTTAAGLAGTEVKKRSARYGLNEPPKRKRRNVFQQLIARILNPLVLVLLVIAGVSFSLGEKISALLVVVMALLSVVLSFVQEYRAELAAEKLSALVHTTITVIRNGDPQDVRIGELVPGDIVELFAGDVIPADLRIISSKDLFINQASLTGESFPAEKYAAPSMPARREITELSNIAFMGSSVVSGTGLAVVLFTGAATQFGAISRKLATIMLETSFDRGIRRFTWLMMLIMLVMVVVIFAINSVFRGNFLEALLFSLGVAVGLAPEMLPMIVTINLSRGAMAMAKKMAIVKRLSSIQNFGAMNVLCTDKTGTLTLDKIVLEKYCDVLGREDKEVLRDAFINSYFQTGLKNLLDRAILQHKEVVVPEIKKVDEVPFDFSRKIMSVIIEQDDTHMLFAKGAPEEIYKKCTHYELAKKILPMDMSLHAKLHQTYDELSAEGFRVLAVAYKRITPKKDAYTKDDEQELILKGYLAFLDPPKPTAKKTIEQLQKLGIAFKVLTGDNELVTRKVCSEVGLDIQGFLTGEQVNALSPAELRETVKATTVFARLDPLQKERVIHALHESKYIVGYLGDGINDSPSLKVADVGISVNNGTSVAKEAADIILLHKSLMVLRDGVLEGRKTFGNIVKYIKMGGSSNFGNMLSVTGASLFLPFLPMLPIQILLNNFLYDLSQTALPSDEVDPEYLQQPRAWDIKAIRTFMLTFGPLSSLFDFITYGVLLFVFKASEVFFHTGWFLESLCTQTLVIYVIRTAKVPFVQSSPSRLLLGSSLLIVSAGVLLTLTPLGQYFQFVIPPLGYFPVLAAIVLSYLFLVQAVKIWFVKKYGYL